MTILSELAISTPMTINCSRISSLGAYGCNTIGRPIDINTVLIAAIAAIRQCAHGTAITVTSHPHDTHRILSICVAVSLSLCLCVRVLLAIHRHPAMCRSPQCASVWPACAMSPWRSASPPASSGPPTCPMPRAASCCLATCTPPPPPPPPPRQLLLHQPLTSTAMC